MGGSGSKPDTPEEEAFLNEVRSRYQRVEPEQEKPVKIEQLWLFPIRGIMGIVVPEFRVSKWGIEYDREWDLFEKGADGSYSSQNKEIKLTLLRQKIVEDKDTKEKNIVVSVIESHYHELPEGLAPEIKIPIKHIDGEVVNTGKLKGVDQGT